MTNASRRDSHARFLRFVNRATNSTMTTESTISRATRRTASIVVDDARRDADGRFAVRARRVGFKRARGAWSCRGMYYVCFIVYEPTSLLCIVPPDPHPALTDGSTLVAHHENPKDTHPETYINFPLMGAHQPRVRADPPPRAPPARSRPHTSTRRQGIIMFTVRASSVQATRHVALNRPARAQRSVAMRAGKVRRSRSFARRDARSSSSWKSFARTVR